MILNFMTTWPKTMPEHLAGKSTNFAEAIWNTLFKTNIVSTEDYRFWEPERNEVSTCLLDNIQKLHTIREDKHYRWRTGMDIHFYVFARTKARLQFAPVVKVKRIQSIEIEIAGFNKDGHVAGALVKIDGKYLGGYNHLKELPSCKHVRRLALNDGFDSVQDFFAYFNKDFTGKIIHWTDLKY